jgi:hypothetical protein
MSQFTLQTPENGVGLLIEFFLTAISGFREPASVVGRGKHVDLVGRAGRHARAFPEGQWGPHAMACDSVLAPIIVATRAIEGMGGSGRTTCCFQSAPTVDNYPKWRGRRR